jgi:UDP-N-acetylmuramate--alanine ligase
VSVLAGRREVHFVGIGGAGMSALAEVLIARGRTVSGCDARGGPVLDRMAALGARVHVGHSPEHLDGADALVVSSAIAADNPELAAARERGLAVVRRAELLAAVMAEGHGIAIAGTHGKSTTTMMMGAVLEAAGWEPTVLVGGRMRGRAGNVRLGTGDWIVAEADEFDRSFLALHPAHAIVTNVEADHLDTYGTANAVHAAFEQFLGRVAKKGVVARGIDDAGARALSVPGARRDVTFGLDPAARVRAHDVRLEGLVAAFTLVLDRKESAEIALQVPGLHNVRNALAAAAMAWALGVETAAIGRGLAAVGGVARRFEVVVREPELTVVDDYAHHPTEITATLVSARAAFPERRLVAVFQPHLYSRTRDLAADFGAALAGADLAFVTGIYPAREAPIPGVTAELVVEAARAAGGVAVALPALEGEALERAAETIEARLEPGDVVLTLGAGDVDGMARRLAGRARRREAAR